MGVTPGRPRDHRYTKKPRPVQSHQPSCFSKDRSSICIFCGTLWPDFSVLSTSCRHLVGIKGTRASASPSRHICHQQAYFKFPYWLVSKWFEYTVIESVHPLCASQALWPASPGLTSRNCFGASPSRPVIKRQCEIEPL